MLDATAIAAADPGAAPDPQEASTARSRNPREETRYADIHVSVGGVHHTIEVEVIGEYRRGYPPMYESGALLPISPAEPEGFVLSRIEYGAYDITQLLTEAQLRVLVREAA